MHAVRKRKGDADIEFIALVLIIFKRICLFRINCKVYIVALGFDFCLNFRKECGVGFKGGFRLFLALTESFAVIREERTALLNYTDIRSDIKHLADL